MVSFLPPTRLISCVTLSIMVVAVAAAQSAPASLAAAPSKASVTPPDPPVTREQLKGYLGLTGVLEGNRAFAKAQLAAKRKTLPAWFPQAVWDDVESRVEAIDLVDVYLPVYRKYVSVETADALILLYQGPTGEELARVSARRIMAALLKGSTGYSADMKAADEMAANGEDAIFAKRAHELSTEQQHSVARAEASLQSVLQQLDNEQNTAFSRKVDEVWRVSLTAHNAELVAAQNAASRTHPSHQ